MKYENVLQDRLPLSTLGMLLESLHCRVCRHGMLGSLHPDLTRDKRKHCCAPMLKAIDLSSKSGRRRDAIDTVDTHVTKVAPQITQWQQIMHSMV